MRSSARLSLPVTFVFACCVAVAAPVRAADADGAAECETVMAIDGTEACVSTSEGGPVVVRFVASSRSRATDDAAAMVAGGFDTGGASSMLGEPCTIDADCDDAAFCNGQESCSAGICTAGIAPDCEDGIGCTADGCNEATDGCVHFPFDIVCDNGLFCDGGEICHSVFDCVAGLAPDCDDGVGCTTDTCDEGADGCEQVASDAACDDGLFCNGIETCDAILDCQAGAGPDLDDGVACTADSCDEPSDQVVHTPVDASCSDGQFCNGTETCDASAGCLAGASPTVDDGVDCTIDSCDEAGDRVVNEPDHAACSDGLFCDGTEVCDADSGCHDGTPPVLDDGVGCTLDACDEANDEVVHTVFDAACDDGQFCNGVELCDAAADCQMGDPPDSDDGVSCTLDACDEATDSMVHAPVDAICDDGQFCNGTESCDEATDCQPGSAPVVDDGVACTDDSCDEAADIIVNSPDDGLCDNGQFCDGAEVCDVGTGCEAGTAVDCDDGVGCTLDACNESLDACDNAPDDGNCDDGTFCDGLERCDGTLDCVAGVAPDCDDGVSCTTDACEPGADACVNLPDHGACDNGTFCDGAEQCDATLGCQAGSPVDCDDGVTCTLDACDDSVDVCRHAAVDFLCDNGSVCDGTETCDEQLDCQPGVALDCGDGNICTDDACDDSTGCSNVDNSAPCDDGSACTSGDICAAGQCLSGTALDCDDGNACTDDVCDAATGCSSVFNSAPCDDGDSCTSGDVCSQGVCAGTSPLDCDDDNPCTDDQCDAGSGCLNLPNSLACDDGDACTQGDACLDGVCVGLTPRDCDDGNSCTDDGCDSGSGCSNLPNTVSCDDGDACTQGDACLDGVCVGLTPRDCDDDNSCTDDGCESGSGCSNLPNTVSCDDGDACTQGDACLDGVCLGLTPRDCDDGNSCTDDGCGSGSGCSNVPNVAACDDGDSCTTGDACSDGLCQGGAAIDCDDGNVCTDDTCDAAGGCSNLPGSHACDDGDACTDADLCADGVCVGGAALDCDDGSQCTVDACDSAAGCTHEGLSCDDGDLCTTDGCEPATGCEHAAIDCGLLDTSCSTGVCDDQSGVCVSEPIPGASCDDGDACTSDGCAEDGSCLHEPLACDDGDPCTVDSCDTVAGCGHEPLECSLLDDACHDGSCDPGSGVCVAGPVAGRPCDDGDACTTGEVCAQDGQCGGGVAPTCDDGDPCTVDVCDLAGGCTHEGVVCDDGVACTFDLCDASSGCLAIADDEFCDDGVFCNGDEVCTAETGCDAGIPVDCADVDVCTLDTCDEDGAVCVHEFRPDLDPTCSGGIGCLGGEPGDPDLVDFEGLAAGAILDDVTSALGAGPIGVYGYNPYLDPDGAGVVYDSSCSGGCSGGDADLGTPHHDYGGMGRGAGGSSTGACPNDSARGNVLIVAEYLDDADIDGLVDVPDDQADTTVSATLDFSEVGPVVLYELVLIDVDFVDSPPAIELLDAQGVTLATFAGAQCGDNGVTSVDLGATPDVSLLRVTLYGSGAIDDILFAPQVCPDPLASTTTTTIP